MHQKNEISRGLGLVSVWGKLFELESDGLYHSTTPQERRPTHENTVELHLIFGTVLVICECCR